MENIINTMAAMTVNNLNNDKFKDSGDGIQVTIGNIISTIIGILGIVCVIIIIMGGIQYMTSSGDAGKVKKAKDTILYGVIGLVICVLAFAITQFVVNAISGSSEM